MGRHPAVIVTREVAIPVLSNVTVALVTSRIRDLPSEAPIGRQQGLKTDSVVNCDNLITVPKSALKRKLGQLGPSEIAELDRALRMALQL